MSERVLIVDDEASARRLLTKQLSLAGFEPVAVEDGHAALKAAATTSIDAIVLDVIMPAMDGFEVCRRLKANPQTAGIPVVFFSTSSSGEYRRRAFSLGAADFLVKPFQTNVLPAHIRAILRQRVDQSLHAGTVISVIGDNRNAGAAAEAIRLAETAALSTAGPVMLIDLESPNGVIGAQLQLAGGPNIRLLLQNTGEPVSDKLIARVARRFQHALEVIPAPYSYAPISQAEPLPQRLVEVLEHLTARGYRVILHLGTAVDEMTLTAMARSEAVRVVSRDESAGGYKALLAALSAGGITTRKILAAGRDMQTIRPPGLRTAVQDSTYIEADINATVPEKLMAVVL